MILESLITDGSRIVFDCSRSTVFKGSVITIDDKFWNDKEIQNAINAGLVRLVSPIPTWAGTEDTPREKTFKFKSNWASKLSFDCLGKFVDKNQYVDIPESKINIREIQNAINSGMIISEDNEYTHERPYFSDRGSIQIDEITLNDLNGISNPNQNTRTASQQQSNRTGGLQRPKSEFSRENQVVTAAKPQTNRPKTIKRLDDSDVQVSSNSSGKDDFFAESKLIDSAPRQPPKPRGRPKAETSTKKVASKPQLSPLAKEDKFDFLTIFGEETNS